MRNSKGSPDSGTSDPSVRFSNGENNCDIVFDPVRKSVHFIFHQFIVNYLQKMSTGFSLRPLLHLEVPPGGHRPGGGRAGQGGGTDTTQGCTAGEETICLSLERKP